MNRADSFTPERVADRLEIQDVVHRWCRAIDRLDYDSMRKVFHPDATDNHNFYCGDVEGLIDWIRQRHRTITFSMHMVANQLIEFAAPDVALSETYVWCIQRYPANAKESLEALTGGQVGPEGVGMDLMACSRYVDRFHRRNEQWRILRRTVVTDWKAIHPFDDKAPVPQPHWNIGRHDTDDFIYRERREMGIA